MQERQLASSRSGVQRVETQHEPVGKLAAQRRLVPRVGLAGKRGQQRGGVPDRRAAVPVGAGKGVHVPAVGGADLHLEGSKAREQRPAAP